MGAYADIATGQMSAGHSRRDWLRATIGPRPLRPGSGSEGVRQQLKRQQLQDLKQSLELAQQRVQHIKLEMRAVRGAERSLQLKAKSMNCNFGAPISRGNSGNCSRW